MHTSLSLYKYIYIYIYIERERERYKPSSRSRGTSSHQTADVISPPDGGNRDGKEGLYL